jgi:hypothetical protein
MATEHNASNLSKISDDTFSADSRTKAAKIDLPPVNAIAGRLSTQLPR